MEESKIRSYIRDSRQTVAEGFTGTHTPRMTAASFALGAFIVLMPTSGTGLFILAAIALAVSQVNRVALFSTAIVFNPLVNLAFYAVSYLAGGVVLGKEMFSLTSVSLQQLMSFSASMLVGSLLVATTVSAVSYVAVYRLASVYGEAA